MSFDPSPSLEDLTRHSNRIPKDSDDIDAEELESNALLDSTDDPDVDTADEEQEIVRELERSRMKKATAHFVRALALLCACSLSVGCHYATYILGPIKSRLSRELGTNNTEFSLLISALTLNSTWTPLVGGVLASRFGTTATSIIATGLIFFGQIILLVGDLTESVRLMTFGLFIFGLGVSPLAVVQESIIVRFFHGHGLGLSMAFGLVVGKTSSFVAAHTSYPLSETFGPHAPFYVASILAGVSFAMNIVYIFVSKWLVASSGTELEASELHAEAKARQFESVSEAEAMKKVAEKRRVLLRDTTKLGDVFWAYLGINVLCGMIWHPFAHLAPDIIHKRFDLSEREASETASYVLIGSTFLYPLAGFIVDRLKRRRIHYMLFMLSSILTLFCYFWLLLPPSFTGTVVPAIASFATGFGFAPLILVVIVPTLVPIKYVPTTLGAHKSLEQVGTTSFQTLAGLVLDISRSPDTRLNEKDAIGRLLSLFFVLNLCQFCGFAGLWWLNHRRKIQAEENNYRSLKHRLSMSVSRVSGEEDQEASDSSTGRPLSRRFSTILPNRQSKHSTEESHCLNPTCSPSNEPLSIRGLDEEQESEAEEQPLLQDQQRIDHSRTSSRRSSGRSDHSQIPAEPTASSGVPGIARSKKEIARGEVFAIICIGLICFTWIFFLGTVFLNLRSKKEREGGSGAGS